MSSFPNLVGVKPSGEGGIRTHAPVKANGFQDRLVMTTSISLRVVIRLFCVRKKREKNRREIPDRSNSSHPANPVSTGTCEYMATFSPVGFKTAAL